MLAQRCAGEAGRTCVKLSYVARAGNAFAGCVCSMEMPWYRDEISRSMGMNTQRTPLAADMFSGLLDYYYFEVQCLWQFCFCTS